MMVVDTPVPPQSLVHHLAEGRCVLFAGSGLSASGGLPTWKSLLQHMVERLHAEKPKIPDVVMEELKKLLEAGKFLEIADYCRVNLDERLYSEILTSQLHVTNDNVDASEPHRLIVNLPFAAIVTTNYDKLLEHAYSRIVGDIPPVATYKDVDRLGGLLFEGKRFILKAHGDIDRPQSLILTANDYRNLMHATPAFNAFFSAILLTKAILFVGYSMNDPDFRFLLDRHLTIFEGYVPERYILMRGAGEVEQGILKRTAKLQVLPYSNHEEVRVFLEALQNGYLDYRFSIKKRSGA